MPGHLGHHKDLQDRDAEIEKYTLAGCRCIEKAVSFILSPSKKMHVMPDIFYLFIIYTDSRFKKY